ncbi:MAG TPA: HAMP domain-containing sensor histidine kinase, partial [Nitrolancea sp.]|nr:HAMP domain-containing sensor histidine kinase [Nitrolancea sp.]
AQDLAERAALAIDNARLYQEARQHAARAIARAEASRAVVAVQFDQRSIIQNITRIVSEQVGDGVVVRLVSGDGQWLDVVAVHHPDPEKHRALGGMVSAARLRIDEGFNAQVLASGQPLHIPAANQDEFHQYLRPEYAGFHQQFGYHTLLIVPLRLRERIIGSIALFRDGESGPYSAAERTFVQDLADVAALAIDNARLYQQAQDAVEVRERFLSMASHELKTPLTTIKALGQLLERLSGQPELDRSRQARLMRQLLQSTERFEELVNDLLDVSRIQQQRLALHPEALDLRELAGEVLDRFGESSERTDEHRLVLEAPEPVLGEWDASRLDQVLTNLISNALKYSPGGGEVRVTVRQVGERAEVTVADQGIGITAEELRILFQPFSRGERVRAQVEGTGLGLYITHEIVEQHGGTVTVASQPDVGSRFSVRLPLRSAPGEPNGQEREP